MLFLKDFWYGNISPGEGRYHTKEEYKKLYEGLSPKSPSWKTIPGAFLVGGTICTVAQGFKVLLE